MRVITLFATVASILTLSPVSATPILKDATADLDPASPKLTRLPDTALTKLFKIIATYPRADSAKVKVVGAFALSETSSSHFVAAWAPVPSFLPISYLYSDGRCYTLNADYIGGTLSNGRLKPSDCGPRPVSDQPRLTPPLTAHLRLIGSAWSYGAWTDQAGNTIITAPYIRSFEPLIMARMKVNAIAAMNSPDEPGGNVTLIGRVNGQLTQVTLEVSF